MKYPFIAIVPRSTLTGTVVPVRVPSTSQKNLFKNCWVGWGRLCSLRSNWSVGGTYGVVSTWRLDYCSIDCRGHLGWCNGWQARLAKLHSECESHWASNSFDLVQHWSEKLCKFLLLPFTNLLYVLHSTYVRVQICIFISRQCHFIETSPNNISSCYHRRINRLQQENSISYNRENYLFGWLVGWLVGWFTTCQPV